MVQVGKAGGLDVVVMVKDVPESQKAPQQQQLAEQRDQHQKQSTATHTHTHANVTTEPLSLLPR